MQGTLEECISFIAKLGKNLSSHNPRCNPKYEDVYNGNPNTPVAKSLSVEEGGSESLRVVLGSHPTYFALNTIVGRRDLVSRAEIYFKEKNIPYTIGFKSD